MPLVLDGIPVAILYADEGTDGHSDRPWQPSVEMLGRHAAACAASLTAVRTAQALRLMSGAGGAAAAAPDSSQEELQAARRYARLLVSEIKLYNEGAVRVGRAAARSAWFGSTPRSDAPGAFTRNASPPRCTAAKRSSSRSSRIRWRTETPHCSDNRGSSRHSW